MKRLLPAIAACLLPSLGVAAKIDFNFDIAPVLSSKCFHCHGPDEKAREAKLRLDLRDEAIKERDGVRAIVPGDPTASELMVRITTKDRDEVMPPPKENHPLTAQEVELFRRWIAEGAEYKQHWSFVKPVRPAVPGSGGFPAAGGDRNVAPPSHPIDAFIRAKLDGSGLAPSPEADRHALIRRLSLDLIGLPPTPEETDAFVNDRSPDAYEKTVDRLLASPAYGERWARMWLDLARYADSTGYGSDKFRLNIWPYRDWVIGAFNRNLPYDQFTIEQLAGDLLPNATTEQIVATAFHRNTMTNVEGGTNDEEWRVAAVKDRIATTGQVWMGLTVGCAQCHTHKFDPITHQDYYRLYAVFNQTEDSDREDEEPKLALPTPEEREKTQRLNGEIAALQTALKAETPELAAEQRAWEERVSQAAQWQTLAPFEIKAESGTTLAAQPDGSFLAIGSDKPETDIYTLRVRPDLGKKITAFRLEALPDDSLPAHGPGRAENGNAVLSELHVAAGPLDAAPTRGRFVRVTLPAATDGLALAEVQVFSNGQNLALRGKASQSSTDYGGEAKRATDGKTDGDYAKGKSVSHTGKDKEPWWEVDLGDEVMIDNVTIWNRTDGVGDRLANFRVQILDAARQPASEQVVSKAPNPSVAVSPSGNRAVALRNPSADFSQDGWAVAQAIDGDLKTGWAFSPETGKPHAAVIETATPTDTRDVVLTFTLSQRYALHTLGRIRLSATTQTPPPRELPPGIRAILAVAGGERDAKQRAELTAYFRPLSRTFAALGKQLESKRGELAAIKPVQLPILRALGENKQRETHVLAKGNFLAPGEKVGPGLIAEFAHFAEPETKIDRLAAARWIVSPENPLTARVAVNRFWSQLFGTGIVETEEDFGSQGSLPSHPELLDWLAVTFMSPKANVPGSTGVSPVASGVSPNATRGAEQSPADGRAKTSVISGGTPETTGGTPVLPGTELALGWDMKALLRLIVTSATYRQSSRVTPEILEKDARNRLLSHAPRRRLDAEAVRDQALALSGLLSRKLGGPSVYPPQPDGLWKVAFNGGQNAYPTSKGEDRYRRGLYTFWRRTMPYPSMVTFDAPSRESCTMRRLPTNTPLQAFVTMNDPAFVECSQALARRLVREGGGDTAARVRYGLRLCLGRPPADEQVKALVALYENEAAAARNDPAAALKLATQPLGPLPDGADAADFAAWTVVANVLLNLDAVLTKN